MVWVWMGEAPADEASIPEYRFLDADSGFHISRRDHVTIQANVRLVMNNLLDLSHAPLLHEGILGHEDSIRAEINTEQQDPYFFVVRRMRGVRPGALTDLQFRRDGQPIDVVLKMRWSAPCNPLNDSLSSEAGGSATEGAGLYGAHILTPVDDRTTLYHFAAARHGPPIEGDDELLETIKQKMSGLRRIAFAQQDEPMIEAQQRYLDRFPEARPVLFEVDAGPVRCNRPLDASIAAEAKVKAST